MGRFGYTAVTDSGKRTHGTLQTRTRREALQRLRTNGYHPLTLSAEATGLGGLRVGREMFRGVPAAHLAVFTRQLSALLKAGLTLVQALRTLESQCEHKRLRRIITDIVERISREGGTLAEAMTDFPHAFNAVYRGIVRAGEEGGNLPAVLDNLARHLTRSARLRRQVVTAFVYPVFLIVLGAAAVFILMTFVIPRFEELFESFGRELPWLTRMLIGVSSFMSRRWWAMLGVLAVALAGAAAALREKRLRLRFDRRTLQVPVMGPMSLKLECARVSRTLGTLLASGVNMLESLRITGETARNQAVRALFPKIRKDVANGVALAAATEKSGLFPQLMINLVRTGEETGELPEMLRELAEIYEDEAERAVDAAVRLVEPVLIVLMGGVIATIVAAVMMPILQANFMAE